MSCLQPSISEWLFRTPSHQATGSVLMGALYLPMLSSLQTIHYRYHRAPFLASLVTRICMGEKTRWLPSDKDLCPLALKLRMNSTLRHWWFTSLLYYFRSPISKPVMLVFISSLPETNMARAVLRSPFQLLVGLYCLIVLSIVCLTGKFRCACCAAGSKSVYSLVDCILC